MASKAGEAAWVGDLTRSADVEAEEGLSFKIFEVQGEEKDETKDILRKARAGVGHALVAMGRSKGPGAARAGVSAHRFKGASGAWGW